VGYLTLRRGVAQPGSARRSGRRGPRFESGRPDWLVFGESQQTRAKTPETWGIDVSRFARVRGLSVVAAPANPPQRGRNPPANPPQAIRAPTCMPAACSLRRVEQQPADIRPAANPVRSGRETEGPPSERWGSASAIFPVLVRWTACLNRLGLTSGRRPSCSSDTKPVPYRTMNMPCPAGPGLITSVRRVPFRPWPARFRPGRGIIPDEVPLSG
jgi:hypothetical protein